MLLKAGGSNAEILKRRIINEDLKMTQVIEIIPDSFFLKDEERGPKSVSYTLKQAHNTNVGLLVDCKQPK